VEALLKEHLVNVLQKVKGSRFLHKYSSEISSLTAVLYLVLTTLVGSRTLGEEYTDLIYVTKERRLATWKRRAGYVLLSTLSPLVLSRMSSWLCNRCRELLDYLVSRTQSESLVNRLLNQLRGMVNQITVEGIVVFNLALFYFFGAYYQLSKRVLGLRYVRFSHVGANIPSLITGIWPPRQPVGAPWRLRNSWCAIGNTLFSTDWLHSVE
jgi:peroxin-10